MAKKSNEDELTRENLCLHNIIIDLRKKRERAETLRGHAEAEVINGIKEIQQLQAEVTGAYNRGYIKGLAEGRE